MPSPPEIVAPELCSEAVFVAEPSVTIGSPPFCCTNTTRPRLFRSCKLSPVLASDPAISSPPNRFIAPVHTLLAPSRATLAGSDASGTVPVRFAALVKNPGVYPSSESAISALSASTLRAASGAAVNGCAGSNVTKSRSSSHARASFGRIDTRTATTSRISVANSDPESSTTVNRPLVTPTSSAHSVCRQDQS